MTQAQCDRVWDAVMAPVLRQWGVPEVLTPLSANPVWGASDQKSVVDALYAHARTVIRMHGHCNS